MSVDFAALRADFPILARRVGDGKPLVYLDSTATSQKPVSVLQAMDEFYRCCYANIHRGIHTLAEEATECYETARARVARFINAPTASSLVFTRNTTEAINLVAYTWARANLKPGDRILLTEMEHHSNLVPWQMLASERGVELDFAPVTLDGLLDMEAYRLLLQRAPKLVAFTHMSNVLGTINPVTEMIRLAHAAGAVVLVDGAQSVPHLPVDVQALDVDFLAFSAHKMLGPSGIGALYGKPALLQAMPPFLGGGDMIRSVQLRSFQANTIPHKFEAGTPAIAEAVGFGAAVAYLERLGMGVIAAHEQRIVSYALERLGEIPGLRVLGPAAPLRGGVVAFSLAGVHPHDAAQILDRHGIAVRAGHHCAQPLHEKFGLPATTRASFYIYNLEEDVDRLVEGIYAVKKIFG